MKLDRKGKISPSKAAKMLDVHRNTILYWCNLALRGKVSRLRNVARHPVSGYFFLDADEIRKIKSGLHGSGS